MDIGVGFLSQHKPVWVVIEVAARVLPQPSPDIVYKRGTATNVEWNKAKRTLAVMCKKFKDGALLTLECPPQDRQAVIDSLVTDLTRGIHKCYAHSLGTIKVQPNSSPVWSSALTLAARRRHALARASHKACRSGQVVPRELVEQHRAAKRALKSGIRKLNRAKYNASINKASSMTRKASTMWSAVKRHAPGENKKYGDACTYKGVPYSGVEEVASALTQKMKDVHTHVPENPDFDQQFHDDVARVVPELLRENSADLQMSTEFTFKEFEVVLKRLQGRDTKSPGPDGVPYWMISKGGGVLQETLLWLYNLMWKWEVLPLEWGHSHIRYLYKKKSKMDLNNYRPISLISCLGKVYTMLWLPRLAKALLPHLAPQQGARGKGTGSLETLWTVTSLIDSVCVEPTQKAYVLLCDTAQAYDTVWRDGMYFILYSYGIRGPLLRMIHAWHTSATMTGMWYDIEGQKVPCSQGVRQGCVLAPLLYVAMVNPLVAPPPSLIGHAAPALAARAFEGGLDHSLGVPIPRHPSEIPNGPVRPKRRSPAKLFVDDVALLALSCEALQTNVGT